MRFLTVSAYFILAIIILASLGVSLPYWFDYTNDATNINQNLNQNLVTYYFALLVTVCLDYVMKLFDEDKSSKKIIFLGICILLILVLIMTIVILKNNSENNELSYLAVFGVVISYVMWWLVNYNNSVFNATNAFGGTTNKALKNG